MLNEKLKELRTSKGYTQSEAAKIVEISAPAYSAYESGTSIPPLNKLITLAQHYNVSLDCLCGIAPKEPSFSNYGDMAKSIHALIATKFFVLSIYNKTWSDKVYEHVHISSYKSTPHIIDRFLIDYNNMQGLRNRDSITEEIFNTWLLSAIDKLSNQEI